VGWTSPQFAGLSAILVRDPNWAPKPYQPLYFAEFGNNAPLSAWLNNYGELLTAARGKELLIAVCPMPFLTTAQRRALRDELIWAYNPICQTGPSHHQHEVQVAQLLNDHPPKPRRRIGFMPECEPAQ